MCVFLFNLLHLNWREELRILRSSVVTNGRCSTEMNLGLRKANADIYNMNSFPHKRLLLKDTEKNATILYLRFFFFFYIGRKGVLEKNPAYIQAGQNIKSVSCYRSCATSQ